MELDDTRHDYLKLNKYPFTQKYTFEIVWARLGDPAFRFCMYCRYENTTYFFVVVYNSISLNMPKGISTIYKTT